MDLDIEMNDFCFNKIDSNINNDNKVKFKSEDDLLLSIEETSYISFQDIKIQNIQIFFLIKI